MAVLPICIIGEPVLHARAAEVVDVDDALRTLVADMVETMHAAPGVGLAAPQVGVGLRVFVWSWTDDAGVESSGVAINPRLWIAPLPIDELTEDDDEGCLSIPGEREPLIRSQAAILEATDLDGTPFRIEATGWLARILQHEHDHLDGILYADRLAHRERKASDKAVKKARWGRPGQRWTPGIDDIDP
ncbi:peptide deformylase [Agrococcus versicolor]|uniref:Peptide deformylase n=1 Tax=Agrococcus versicolor TaxID=501482 RepID=A0ABN3AW40_9MICO